MWKRSAIDTMHMEGNVAKHAIEHLWDSILRGETKARKLIDSYITDVLRPVGIGQPKALGSSFWKTFDFHQWLLILMLPTIAASISTTAVNLTPFLNIMGFFVMGLRLLLNPHTAAIPHVRRLAGSLLSHFVKMGETEFGSSFRGISIHQVYIL